MEPTRIFCLLLLDYVQSMDALDQRHPKTKPIVGRHLSVLGVLSQYAIACHRCDAREPAFKQAARDLINGNLHFTPAFYT